MRGTLRWARADLRARRGQALFTIAVVAGVVAALFLATVLLQGAVNPWQQLFDRTRGADVLIYFANGTNTGDLHLMRDVQFVVRPELSRGTDTNRYDTALAFLVETEQLQFPKKAPHRPGQCEQADQQS